MHRYKVACYCRDNCPDIFFDFHREAISYADKKSDLPLRVFDPSANVIYETQEYKLFTEREKETRRKHLASQI